MDENGKIVSLIPNLDIEEDCPLLGIAADSSLTVDKLFIKQMLRLTPQQP